MLKKKNNLVQTKTLDEEIDELQERYLSLKSEDVASHPGTMAYPHTTGSAPITLYNLDSFKKSSLELMNAYAYEQLTTLAPRAQLLTKQYEKTKKNLFEAKQDEAKSAWKSQLKDLDEQANILKSELTEQFRRQKLARLIYSAEMTFIPVYGTTYHLYQKENGGLILSMLSPKEWGKHPFKEFLGSAQLLSDKTFYLDKDQGGLLVTANYHWLLND